jgi:uncharacterized repeat protein (TIGR03806 family)
MPPNDDLPGSVPAAPIVSQVDPDGFAGNGGQAAFSPPERDEPPLTDAGNGSVPGSVIDGQADADPPAGENLFQAGLLSRPRAAGFLNLPARGTFQLRGWDLAEVFTSLTFLNATFIAEAPGTGHLFVAEREGRVYAFVNDLNVTQRTLVLDISSQTLGNGDKGLVGIAFHPEFGQVGSLNRGYIYLHYPYIAAPVALPAPQSTLTRSRLSRFTVDLETLHAEPSSELVLMDQLDEHTLHLGGALFFHPLDGYLYLTVGDEGLPCPVSDNCGRIDKDLFGGVLRIDVDPNEDADSHAILKQPSSGITANYTIPNDNPFVGQENALEEFYAIGLRSPHRMTHDAVDDIAWIGDVGQTQREELDILKAGANFQWNDYEGFLRHREPQQPIIGVWTDPLLDFTRAEVQVVVGGYVYRGQRFPELYGKYIFGDFWFNSIFALSYTSSAGQVQVQRTERLATQVGGRARSLTSFGVDATGEIYATSLGRDEIKTLIFREQSSTNLPTQLSATGALADVSTLLPSAALVAYDVQNALWSDGANKSRWMALPEGTNIGFAEHGPWQFPPGTVFVKQFEMAMDERSPDERRRLETRVLVAASDGTYYGASYKWNQAGTDALLLLESQTEALEIVDADGTTRVQEYFYPGPTDCMTCHNADAGYVLGVRTAQLNGDRFYRETERNANQLWTWSEVGMFDRALTQSVIESYPKLAALDDETRTEEERVRSYWDSNCSMCHGVVDGLRADWDARYQTPLAEQRVVGGASVGDEGSLIVSPGNVEASLLVQRDRATEPGVRMPPLGRTRVDRDYIELLERWVLSLNGTAATTVSPAN